MFFDNFHTRYISPRANLYLLLLPTVRNSCMLKFIILRLHCKIFVKIRVDNCGDIMVEK